jgi:hypothetical protein
MRALLLPGLLPALLLAALPSLAAPPDLVVVVVIDQFPQEYVERFAPYFSKGGFPRLMTDGAYYPQAWHPHATTYTCVGHAAIGTGRNPREHGIVANEWYDEERERTVYCVEDPRVRSTAGKEMGYSPVLLDGDSLGDRLQETYDPALSKVIGIGLKDRSGILMAGKKADAAYWFDPAVPGFVSSTYYRFNPRVLEFNRGVAEFIASVPEWAPSDLIPAADLPRVTWDPPEVAKHKGGSGFPHRIEKASQFVATPFANDLVLDLARHVIDVEWLGREDGAPDILWIGLSAMDYLGHSYGPDSLEVADAVVRLDRSLESFVSDLAVRFGDRVTVAVTADHGTQSIPEVLVRRGKAGGRVALTNPAASVTTIGGMSPVRRDLEKRIARKLGIRLSDASPMDDRMILRTTTPNFYLNWTRIEALRLDPERVRRAVRDSLLEIEGVAAAFTSSDLSVLREPASSVERAARLSFRADRSGDVVAYLEPGYIYSGGTTGSTHGQPVEADQHVLLMLWGAGVPRGVHPARVEIPQLARTLGALLGVDAGTPGGEVLPGFAK